jgi:hypothetical protein
MGYSSGREQRIIFDLFDFGGGADGTRGFRGPKGKGGQLIDYGVTGVVEAFNGDTLDPQISVGTAADRDAYGEELTVNPAITTEMSLRTRFNKPEDIDDYILAAGLAIPPDTDIVLHLIASTGTNLTGQGQPFVTIMWDD